MGQLKLKRSRSCKVDTLFKYKAQEGVPQGVTKYSTAPTAVHFPIAKKKKKTDVPTKPQHEATGLNPGMLTRSLICFSLLSASVACYVAAFIFLLPIFFSSLPFLSGETAVAAEVSSQNLIFRSHFGFFSLALFFRTPGRFKTATRNRQKHDRGKKKRFGDRSSRGQRTSSSDVG